MIGIEIVRYIFIAIFVYLVYNTLNKHIIFSKLDANFLYHPFFYLSFSLVFFNYLFEYKKWELTLNSLKIKENKKNIISSFFAGIITGLLTPNMQGNFLGRIYYFKRIYRIPIIILTLIGNFASLLVTLLFGIIALVLLHKNPLIQSSQWYIYIAGFIFTCSFILFFTFQKSVCFQEKWRWFKRIAVLLKETPQFRWKTIAWSFLRYLVFSSQFVLLLVACGLSFSGNLWLWVAVIYLFTTLIPSAFLGKIGIRESVSLTVLSQITNDGNAILTASLLVWIINLALPAGIGLLICRKK